MYTENLPTLRIHNLSQEQYDREAAAGNIENFSLYLTPEVDSIIAESVTGAGWRYRKWASGIAECWISNYMETLPYVMSESPIDGFSYCRVSPPSRPIPFVQLCGFTTIKPVSGDAYYIQDKTLGNTLYFHTNEPNTKVQYSSYVIGTWK